MSLQEQLTKLKEENLAKFPEAVKNVLLGDLKELSESDLVEKAPNTGDSLNGFTLPNHLGEVTSLADLRKKGPVVVTFTEEDGARIAILNYAPTSKYTLRLKQLGQHLLL